MYVDGNGDGARSRGQRNIVGDGSPHPHAQPGVQRVPFWRKAPTVQLSLLAKGVDAFLCNTFASGKS